MGESLPSRARVVVVGGGVIGTSIAYHLGHLGWTDVVLVERDQLTSGTTWHAAGLMVTFGSTSETSTEMRKYTRDLYARLEAETGLATGLQAGRLHRARRRSGSPRGVPPGRGVQPPLRRRRRTRSRRARSQSCSRSPAPTTSSPASTSPDDGRVNPVDVTMALAKGARQTGVHDRPGRGRHRRRSSATARSPASRTDHGDIECRVRRQLRRHVGPPARRAVGVTIPLQAAEHYYLITEPIEGLDAELAGDRGPGHRTATTARRCGGLMIGLFEPVVRAVERRRHPGRLLVRRARRPTGTAWRRTSRRR